MAWRECARRFSSHEDCAIAIVVGSSDVAITPQPARPFWLSTLTPQKLFLGQSWGRTNKLWLNQRARNVNPSWFTAYVYQFRHPPEKSVSQLRGSFIFIPVRVDFNVFQLSGFSLPSSGKTRRGNHRQIEEWQSFYKCQTKIIVIREGLEPSIGSESCDLCIPTDPCGRITLLRVTWET